MPYETVRPRASSASRPDVVGPQDAPQDLWPTRLKLVAPKATAKPQRKRTHAKWLAEWTVFRAAQAELALYALIPNTKRKENGSQQFKVPAYRRELATAAQRKKKISTQPTIVLPAPVAAKLRQHERWGSDKVTGQVVVR